jgi:hypothetical protein
VATKIAPAQITFSAAKINFTDHSLANKIARAVADAANELMAGNAFETHVASEDLQIRGADAGEMNLEERCLIFTSCGATAGRPDNL